MFPYGYFDYANFILLRNGDRGQYGYLPVLGVVARRLAVPYRSLTRGKPG